MKRISALSILAVLAIFTLAVLPTTYASTGKTMMPIPTPPKIHPLRNIPAPIFCTWTNSCPSPCTYFGIYGYEGDVLGIVLCVGSVAGCAVTVMSIGMQLLGTGIVSCTSS